MSRAMRMKEEGNEKFKAGRHEEAIPFYTKGINGLAADERGSTLELALYTQLLDDWTALALTGSSTWLPGLDPRWSSQADVERALETRATVATTGPFISLHVDGVGPGGLVPETHQAPMLRLMVEAPTLKKVVWHSVATALASMVLPVPGGPNISTPFHGRRMPWK